MFYPGLEVTCFGDPNDYANLVVESDHELPPESDLITRIDAYNYNYVWRQIHDERDRRKAGGLLITVDGVDYWAWTDDPSRDQYALYTNKAERYQYAPDYVLAQWKSMNGTFFPMTLARLHEIIDRGVENEETLFEVAEQHRQQMLASTDPLAYDWSGGWPPIYGESAQQQQGV
jgi:hypothetical protein